VVLAAEDCCLRVKRIILRKAASQAGGYRVGDLIELKRVQGAKTEGTKWSHAPRIIGLDGDEMNAKTVCALYDGVPVCVGQDLTLFP